MILVTGGAGNVGANVVQQLLDAGEKVRVITRDPGGRTFPDQVEVMPGDLTRPETLPTALSGVDRAFLFPVFDAVDGFLEAARQADLQHVVLLSSAAVTYPTPGWIGELHLRVERAIAASGLPWTHVRPDAFMTNDLAWAHQIINGGVVRGAHGNAAVAPVDPRDIAAVAVRALLDHRVGEAYLLTGPQPLTQIDRVRIIAETIGRPLRFEEQPRERFREQMLRHGAPAPAADALLDELSEREGKTAQVLPTVEDVTGRPASPTPNGPPTTRRHSPPWLRLNGGSGLMVASASSTRARSPTATISSTPASTTTRMSPVHLRPRLPPVGRHPDGQRPVSGLPPGHPEHPEHPEHANVRQGQRARARPAAAWASPQARVRERDC
ncbi:NAD(P)H-binding protein [Nonomuraea sp. NPDC050643]|uniref:NAD(P)H-binding protein n=1 Tax=Nonomuraea sp. NPDC050643 TaxID=3155660 RepID=UPI0033C525F9